MPNIFCILAANPRILKCIGSSWIMCSNLIKLFYQDICPLFAYATHSCSSTVNEAFENFTVSTLALSIAKWLKR